MDLHLSEATATADERAAVDALLGPEAESDGRVVRGGREARAQRHLLLPVLHGIQSAIGWISAGAVNYAAERLTVPPADIYGVATFYGLFSTEQRPPTVVHVCDDIACQTAGAEDLLAALGDGETIVRSPCLGQCDRAPAVLVQIAGPDGGYASLAPATAAGVAAAVDGDEVPETEASIIGSPDGFDPCLLARVGTVDPASLDDYRSHGGYLALRRALSLGPAGVVRELRDSDLRGRGGAAFPTGVKWAGVAAAPARPHYVICNADESEPGTFKDRVLMEEDPFAIVEAMTIAGYAIAAEKGYLYVRGEYPVATHRIESAIDQTRSRGLLGDNVMGGGFAFDIEIRRGAGAYICGEETALFNSIEGLRGEPHNKPPYPTEFGLFGKPTLVNNVETLSNVLDIVREGGPAFAAVGSDGSTGPKLFCLSGNVARPGVYEVPFGATVGDLLDLAGGVSGSLQALLIGGAAGSFIGPEDMDLPLTFEAAREAGVALGSGVVMAFNESVDLNAIVLRIAAFMRDESCGQCVPCRVGTVRQEEALHRMLAGSPLGSADIERKLIADIDLVMRDASICGLGQTAGSAVRSALDLGLIGARS